MSVQQVPVRFHFGSLIIGHYEIIVGKLEIGSLNYVTFYLDLVPVPVFRGIPRMQ